MVVSPRFLSASWLLALFLIALLLFGRIIHLPTTPALAQAGAFAASGSLPNRSALQGEKAFVIADLPFASAEAPALDQGRVVWYDDRTQGPTDVWGYDLLHGQPFQVTDQRDAQLIADLSGNLAVYEDNRNGTWDIYAKRLDSGEEFAVATGPSHQRYPRIWQDYIVYQDEGADFDQSDVYLYQVTTGETTALAATAGYQGWPDIDDGRVVWIDLQGKSRISLYDIAAARYQFYPTLCDNECKPRIDDKDVVWSSPGDGRENRNIYLYDAEANSGEVVYEAPGQQLEPAISDSLIVWQDRDSYGNWNVFVHERGGVGAFPITLHSSQQMHPAVEGNLVVWQDNRRHTWAIYGEEWKGANSAEFESSLPHPTSLNVGARVDGQLYLAWRSSATADQHFVIQRAEGIFGAEWVDYKQVSAGANEYIDTAVTSGQSYWYRMRAVSGDEDSPYSNESYGTVVEAIPNLDERYLHLLINEARMAPQQWNERAGVIDDALRPLDPVAWQPSLAFAARGHAVGMNNSHCCQGHLDLAGRGASERAAASGYPYSATENLFEGYAGKEEMEAVQVGFWHSEGHRANMMDAKTRQLGLGFAAGGRGTVVELFSAGPAGDSVPPLPSGLAIPATATVDTPVEFLVSFWNPAREAPTRAVVVVDGQPYDLDLRSGESGRGTYQYAMQLPLGQHAYSFEFTWGDPAQTARLPATGLFTDLQIIEPAAQLHAGRPASQSVPAEQQSTLSWPVANHGDVVARNVHVRFYQGSPQLDGALLGEAGVPEIEAGAEQSAVMAWTPAAPGPTLLYMQVDEENQIVETNERDNLSSVWVQVEGERQTAPVPTLRPTPPATPTATPMPQRTRVHLPLVSGR